MYRRRRRSSYRMLVWVLLAIGAFWIWNVWSSRSGGAEHSEPYEAVRNFWAHESLGDFGSSWELFHSQMKERFSKDSYIQRRAHVFMQDFGANTFEYEIGQEELLPTWRMSEEQPQLENVYRIPVTLRYDNSYFGQFEIRQVCYVAKEAEQWTILWAYQPF